MPFRIRQGLYILSMLIFTMAGMMMSSCFSNKDQVEKLFRQIPSDLSGIDFRNDLVETEAFNIIEYLYFNNGGGVAVGDINNDGLPDLYFTANQLSNKLYLNLGDFKFQDITEKAGVTDQEGWKTGVTMADVNGDGWLDLYVCHLGEYKGIRGKNKLYINRGDQTFSEEGNEYGLDFAGFSTQAAFFDYDMDGDLDMYLLNHSVHSSRTYGPSELRRGIDPLAGDRLYRNNLDKGENRFEDVSSESGIYRSNIGYGLGISIADLNLDGFPDMYISNDFHEDDYLYINQGDGTFKESFEDMMAYSSRSSMGSDIGDLNNDGFPDVFVLDMLPEDESILKRSGGEDEYDLHEIKRQYGYKYQFVRNTLQLNLGNGMFSEIGRYSGVFATDWSWSPLICDMDNDGWDDIFIANGIFRRPNDLDYIDFLTNGKTDMRGLQKKDLPDKDLYEKMPLDKLENYAYRNNGDLTFANMSKAWGLNIPTFSNGAAYADLDRDGDLDLVWNNINDKASIYRNSVADTAGRHFLRVSFTGEGGNAFGIGAKVMIFNDGVVRYRENQPNHGFMSSATDGIHVGLGEWEQLDSIYIDWPSGKRQVLAKVATNQVLQAREVEATLQFQIDQKMPSKEEVYMVDDSLTGLKYTHRNNDFIDFDFEGLIPRKLSEQGPCISVGDFNGDQMDDIFIGGASGQAGAVFIQEKNDFKRIEQKALNLDLLFEDVDASLFDADQDGDLDLYVVSGGGERLLPDVLMYDRLYLNDGQGNFERSRESLPRISHNGSCVKTCDFDRDGDMDIFLGSRSLPRAYGLNPDSYLFENTGKGVFIDVSQNRIPGLSGLGMVNDAAWVDLEEDGDLDLVVVGDWMPITVFINEDGSFTRSNGNNGLENSQGWWNTIQPIDFDTDGDIDFLAGNLGLNNIFRVGNNTPLTMYINDFDQDGKLDPIICHFKQGQLYPIASREELERQIKGLQGKYESYADYAGKTIQEIFPEDLLENAIIQYTRHVESSLVINNGDGTFHIKPLPNQLQFSPVNRFIELKGQDRTLILAAGNIYGMNPTFGRHDASFGWLMTVHGNTIEVIDPIHYGFRIRGEVQDLATIKFKNSDYILVGINDREIEVLKRK